MSQVTQETSLHTTTQQTTLDFNHAFELNKTNKSYIRALEKALTAAQPFRYQVTESQELIVECQGLDKPYSSIDPQGERKTVKLFVEEITSALISNEQSASERSNAVQQLFAKAKTSQVDKFVLACSRHFRNQLKLIHQKEAEILAECRNHEMALNLIEAHRQAHVSSVINSLKKTSSFQGYYRAQEMKQLKAQVYAQLAYMLPAPDSYLVDMVDEPLEPMSTKAFEITQETKLVKQTPVKAAKSTPSETLAPLEIAQLMNASRAELKAMQQQIANLLEKQQQQALHDIAQLMQEYELSLEEVRASLAKPVANKTTKKKAA